MGGFSSKPPAATTALSAQLVERPDAAEPAYSASGTAQGASSGGLLDDSMQLLSQDVEWLDESAWAPRVCVCARAGGLTRPRS